MVGKWHWGVTGAGTATVISQAISVLLCAFWIRKRIPALQPERKEWRIDRHLLKETVSSGALTALQQAAQPVGKLMIQSVINAQGVITVDAFNAVCRVDDFACIPAQSIGHSMMTCVAQNRGAGQWDRVRRTLLTGLCMGICYFPLIFALTQLLKQPVITWLSPESDGERIVAEGVRYLTLAAWFFIYPCVLNALQGYLRGLGKMSIVLLGTCIQIGIRALCVYLLVPRIGIIGEAWGCMAGWSCQLVFEFFYYTFVLKIWHAPGSGKTI